MIVYVRRLVGGAALLLGAGLCAAIVGVGSTFTLAASSAKSTFDCSSSTACVTATNSGAGAGLSSSANDANGITALTSSGVASGVYGENDASAGGTGVEGLALGNFGTAGFYADAGVNGATGLHLTQNFSGFSWMILGVNAGSSPVFAAGNTGNLTISGLLYDFGNCYLGCSRTRRVVTYGAMASQPLLHDDGTAQLRDGVASVPLDAAFSRAIGLESYVVFVTPEGPTKGMYIAERRAAGFVVREDHGGHGSAAFTYRIIAHPYGVHAPRLPPITDLRDTERLARGLE